ncbi:hypothetical protein P3T42_003821 [Paraburkholderia sp. GAS38]|uniref:hypothetical protein n=1 Tax=Paraburkholderia sp. GAS38 TaxID=3035133 RepID=UPI003D19C249
MVWPFGAWTPAESTKRLMGPTLASQIAWRQMQIPFGGIRIEKIPLNEISRWRQGCFVPLRDVREIPNRAGYDWHSEARFSYSIDE